MTATLLSLPYSPWSERARWALDIKRIEYKKRTYQPLFGELELRYRLKRLTGPVTVPLLILEDGVIGDSFDIARWADAHGSGVTLFPAGKEEEIKRWNDLSQKGLAAGRALSLSRIVKSDEALIELIPRSMRFGKPSLYLARFGVERTRAKYGTLDRDLAAYEEDLISVLEELRRTLGPNPHEKPSFVLGELSYADITIAQILIGVSPHEGKYVRMGEHTRRLFGNPALKERFSDLVRWRDQLYAKYREPS